MKKKIIFLIAIICNSFSLHAENTVVVPNVSVPQGKTGVISVELNNDKAYTAFSMRMTLPEGVSYVSLTKGDRMVESHGLTGNSNTGMIACLSTANESFIGNSGELFSIIVSVDEGLEEGAILQAKLSEVTFATTLAEETLEDVTFNITITEPRLVFDENATSMPSFTAGEKDNVSMARTIKANQWSTIVLPFTLTKAKAEAAFGSDVQLAEFSGFTVDYGDDDENVTPLGIVVNFSTYTMGSKKPMTGGKMFLIKTSSEITSFEADDCTLVATVTDTEKTDEYDTAGKFTGSFVKTKVPADGLFIAENKFWYSTGDTNIKAFRGWFELGAVLDKETDFGAKVAFFIDDIPTSVDGLDVGARHQQGDVYTLDGLYVGRNIPMEWLKKGIYIVNGKKVVIK